MREITMNNLCSLIGELKIIDRFLESCSLPKLNKEAVPVLNRPVKYREIETIINNFLKNKGPYGFLGVSPNIQKFTVRLLELFQKFKDKEILPITIYEANIALKPKANGDIYKK